MSAARSIRESIVSLGLARFGRTQHRTRRPDRIHARFQLERLEERCLLSGVSAVTEFPVLTSGSNPLGITAGPDGNLWFTDGGTNSVGVAALTTSSPVSVPAKTTLPDPSLVPLVLDGPDLWDGLPLKKRTRST
jgi:hypothetical protein